MKEINPTNVEYAEAHSRYHRNAFQQVQHREYTKLWRLQPDKAERRRIRQRERWKNDSDYRNKKLERSKTTWENLVRKLMDILGGPFCSRCGFSDVRALQFDHIRGGGAIELRKFGNNMSMVRYYSKHPEEAKTTLRVYCANCNIIKRHENNLLKH